MNRVELEGVLAHELSHIKNYDILVSTLAVTLVGVIAIAVERRHPLPVVRDGPQPRQRPTTAAAGRWPSSPSSASCCWPCRR